MLQPEKVIVDNKEYIIYQIPPMYGIKILLRLVKIAGEPAAMAFALVAEKDKLSKENLLDIDINPDLAGLIMQRLISGIDEDEITETIISLMKYVKVGSEKKAVEVNLDVHFGGKMLSMFKVIGKVIEVNFADFLGGVNGIMETKKVAEAGGTTLEK